MPYKVCWWQCVKEWSMEMEGGWWRAKLGEVTWWREDESIVVWHSVDWQVIDRSRDPVWRWRQTVCCVRNASSDVFCVGGTAGPSVLVPSWNSHLLLQEPLCAEFVDDGRHARKDILHSFVYRYVQTTARRLLRGLPLSVHIHRATGI